MANQSLKKIHGENQKLLTILKFGTVFVNLSFLILKWALWNESLTYWIMVFYGLSASIALYLTWMLYQTAQPVYQDNQLVSVGDLNLPGLTQYAFDIIYITWLTHLLAIFTNYAWFLYSIVPLGLMYFIWTKISPFLSSSESQEAPISKRQQKRAQQQGPKIKYR